MKSAKDMFEDLGYELIEDGKTYLRYANYFDNKKYMGGEMVDFDKKKKSMGLKKNTGDIFIIQLIIVQALGTFLQLK